MARRKLTWRKLGVGIDIALIAVAAIVALIRWTPTVYSGRACTVCGGAGEGDCPDCINGKYDCICESGLIDCSGSICINGSVDCPQCTSGCSFCGYTGRLTCTICNGTGIVICAVCGGTGLTKCVMCNGVGRAECYHCDGTGKEPQ